MRDVFYLAWRYLAYHRLKTVILIASTTLIVYLPLGLNILVDRAERQLKTRADSTPLLVGAKGSPLELVLRSLYFESDVPSEMRYAEFQRIERADVGMAIPLHASFRTRHSPIVATSQEYFQYRRLKIARGELFELFGECVLGARAASAARAGPGDSVVSAPGNVFDFAGTYPLKMKVVGVLQATGTPDDSAVFVSLKTAWIIAGLGHGHQPLAEQDAAATAPQERETGAAAHASANKYNEITPENIASFHFHGDQADFPITAVIVLPEDDRASTMLQGKYVADEELAQVVRPPEVIDKLLDTILRVRSFLLIAATLLATAAVSSMALVFMLSYQLRRREMETISKIGGSPARIALLVATEILGVIGTGTTCALALTLATIQLAPSLTRLFL